MAKRLTPPQKKSYSETPGNGLLVYLVLMAATAFFGWLWSSQGPIVWVVVAIFWAVSIWRLRAASSDSNANRKAVDDYNAQVYAVQFEEWQSSWLCHKCGYIGKIDPK